MTNSSDVPDIFPSRLVILVNRYTNGHGRSALNALISLKISEPTNLDRLKAHLRPNCQNDESKIQGPGFSSIKKRLNGDRIRCTSDSAWLSNRYAFHRSCTILKNFGLSC